MWRMGVERKIRTYRLRQMRNNHKTMKLKIRHEKNTIEYWKDTYYRNNLSNLVVFLILFAIFIFTEFKNVWVGFGGITFYGLKAFYIYIKKMRAEHKQWDDEHKN